MGIHWNDGKMVPWWEAIGKLWDHYRSDFWMSNRFPWWNFKVTRNILGLTFFVGKNQCQNQPMFGLYQPFMMIWGVVYYCFNHIKHHQDGHMGSDHWQMVQYQPWEPPMPRGKESSNPSSYLEGTCTAYFCWGEVSFWSFWSLILYLTTLVSSCFSSRSLETITHRIHVCYIW